VPFLVVLCYFTILMTFLAHSFFYAHTFNLLTIAGFR
jgi:hypothetical protein